MIYAYKCRTCGRTQDSKTRADSIGPCSHSLVSVGGIAPCDGTLTRLYIIRTEAQMPEHWNKTLNRPIHSLRQFDEGLKRASHEASLRTGMAHDFQRIDPTDKAAVGVTDEGMDATNRQRRKLGLPTTKM